MKNVITIGLMLILIVTVFMGCFDEDTTSSEDEEEGIYGVSLMVCTKAGGLGSHKPYTSSIHKLSSSIGTQYLLLIKNEGNVTDSFIFSSDAPSDWVVDFESGNEVNDLPSGEWMYKIVTINVNAGSSDTSKDIAITATSKSDDSKFASILTKNTVISFEDETADLDKNPAIVDYNLVYYGGGTDVGEKGWYYNQGSEFEASNVIEGFKEAIKGMMVGQTKVVETPPEKAYGYEDEKHVGGRPLVFEITMLDTNTED